MQVMGDCVIGSAQSESALAKQRLRMRGEPKPHGHKIVARCGNPRCIAPDHSEFVLWESWREHSPLRQLAYAVDELPLDGHMDLPNFPNDVDSVRGLASYLHGMTIRHLVVRRLCPSGVRIFATGTFRAMKESGEMISPEKSEKYYPAMNTVSSVRPHPNGMTVGAFILGLYWGEFESFPAIPRCKVRGCAYPAISGQVCRYHVPERHSPTFDRRVDKWDIYLSKDDDRMYGSKWPLFFSDWIGKDRTNFLHIYSERNGFPAKTAYEKTNDEWWQKNVVEKGLITDADGIAHVIDSAHELNTLLGKEASKENIQRFFGLQTSGSGKMRRGGGRGKIRKKQRRRAAGWTGSRDDTKSNKPDRDTIEVQSDWEVDDAWGAAEDDYSEDAMA